MVAAAALSAQAESRFVDTFNSALTAESAGVDYLQRSSRGDAVPAGSVATISDGVMRITGTQGETGRVHVKGMGSDNISVSLRAEFANHGEEDATLRPRHTLGLMLRSRPDSNFGSGDKDDADSGYVAVELLNNGGILVRQRSASGNLEFISSTKANLITGQKLYEYAPGKLVQEFNGRPFDLDGNGVLGAGEPFDFNVELIDQHIFVRINDEVIFTGSLELAAGKGGNEVSIFKGRPGKFEIASDLLIHELSISPLEPGKATPSSEVEEPKSGLYLQLESVEKIWDAAPHQAFTDLIRYRDQWVCAFREGDVHDGGIPGSRLRILTSRNGKEWQDAGQLSDSRGDIRDAKLSITPDGRLMMLTAIQLFRESDDQPRQHQTIAFYSDDAESWVGPRDVTHDGYWLWGLSWHEGVGYSIGYEGENYTAHLYKTNDGESFTRVVEDIQAHTGKPNESAIVFRDGHAFALLRTFKEAYLGRSDKPYEQWNWTKLTEKVGGPELIELSGGQLLAGGRRYLDAGQQVTSLMWLDPEENTLTEAIRLVSGGDTSYPGIVEYDGKLYVSYYSSHEGVTSIYFAVIKITPVDSMTDPISTTDAPTVENNKPSPSVTPYFLYEPTETPEDTSPSLLVYLYGAGGSADNFNLKRPPYEKLRNDLIKQGYYILVPELGPYHFMNDQASEDMHLLIKRICAEHDVPADHVDFMGTSMGAGSVLAYAAAKPDQVRAVCAVMPMTDMAAWIKEKPKYRPKLIQAYGASPEDAPQEYARRSAVHQLGALGGIPILLLHGTDDTVVSTHHSTDLHQLRRQRGDRSELILVEGGGHSDNIVTDYQSEVVAFFLNRDNSE